jgi:hypothetical protein
MFARLDENAPNPSAERLLLVSAATTERDFLEQGPI